MATVNSLEEYFQVLAAAMSEALAIVADETLDAADVNCPRDTETLLNSRRRTDVVQNGTVLECFGGYGVSDDENPKTHESSDQYAGRVHEDMSMPHPHGGTAKWLENAATAKSSTFTADIARLVSARLQ